MIVFKHIKDIDNQVKRLKKQGHNIGFIPTMGALHKGHISLISASCKKNDITVCSIFINPTQFNDKADFEKYPVTIDNDIDMLINAGCDILFLPSVKEMYPRGFANKSGLNFGFLAQTLEGEHRPGHFDGMAQIVEKLLKVVRPQHLYMGQKDYQQQLIVGQLIKKRRLKTQLVTRPTMREDDGLAMSSRNVRLTPQARIQALNIYKTLSSIKQQLPAIKKSNTANWNAALLALQSSAFNTLKSNKGIEPEYLEIRNAQTLAYPQLKKEKLVALVAAKVGGVRLIDNMLL